MVSENKNSLYQGNAASLIGYVLLFLASATIRAADTKTEDEIDADLYAELMSVVEESTEIATKSKMNSDFVPGMVTILNGREMEALGARTVSDALALIPGVLTTRTNTASPTMIVRGISYPFNTGNVKILVNSVTMSREGSGANNSITYLPIEQVERIEFIRGPGSILYGGYASMGVLNIITREDTNSLSGRIQSNLFLNGSGQLSIRSNDEKLKLDINLAGFDSNQTEAPDGFDADEDRLSGFMALDIHGYKFRLQRIDRDYTSKNGPSTHEENQSIALSKHFNLLDTLDAGLFAAFNSNNFDEGPLEFEGDQWELRTEISWKPIDRHELFFRAAYTVADIDESVAVVPSPPGPPGGAPTPLRTEHQDNLKRNYYSFSIQDRFSLTDNLSITGGIRYDNRIDLRVDRFTPRLSMVWQVSDHHILKSQYAEGFRAPTFFELYGGGRKRDLDLEIVKTAEISYIYRRINIVGRATIFYTWLDDMIFPRIGNFANDQVGRSKGIELEWEQQINPRLKMLGNVSYVNSWENRNPASLRQDDTASADWLANITLSFKLFENVVVTGRWNYAGKRNIQTVNVGSENRLNITLNAYDVFARGLTFRAGVQNLAHDTERGLLVLPTGIDISEFPDRHIWFQIAYDFQ